MATDSSEAKAAIREVVENWVLWRDSADWDRFATVWHDDGWMTATWFQGPGARFGEVSKEGFERGVNILHLLGGCSIDVEGERAIAQTKMTILQRGLVDAEEADVECVGRFYDFFARRAGRWAIVRRQPIYEKDRMIAVRPDAVLRLDAGLLHRYPVGYRHLAYLQRQAGHAPRLGLPGLRGPEVELLYREGRDWLAGSPAPGVPL